MYIDRARWGYHTLSCSNIATHTYEDINLNVLFFLTKTEETGFLNVLKIYHLNIKSGCTRARGCL